MVKKICLNCVTEPYLIQLIQKEEKLGKCSFCEAKNLTYNFNKISKKVKVAIKKHFEKTANGPTDREVLIQNFLKEEWERKGEKLQDIIEDQFGICYEAAKEITHEFTEEDDHILYDYDGEDFDDAPHYIKKEIDDGPWSAEWDQFTNILKTESRFFNQKLESFLRSIFKDLNSIVTTDNKSVLTKAGPNEEIKSLYRARVFQSRDKLFHALEKPEIHLGPPPSEYASDGRMNARGISVFYGATDKETAIAEVRPPTNSTAAVAKFNLVRTLQLLDLRNLEKTTERISIFSPQYQEKMEKAKFLSKLSSMLTRPIMPDDEVFEYLPTQAIADYLSSQTNINIDGIIFPSVQGDGTNIVLFKKSSKVNSYKLPIGTETEVNDYEDHEDGGWRTYSIIDWVPTTKKEKKKNTPISSVVDLGNGALEIDIESIEIHDIGKVKYPTISHRVNRKRIEDPYI
ncbi:RES family NAD+ phosphorylase [Elizabethkingia anophelis]|uniref:RES domain-containing protein n=1 Tax=Elizabethkingia anophelis TaxID=1117645 RepID=UPI00136ED464|nr:RES domain-containing protein [Elizabethkingia anophelis]MYY43997.1 RES domain-containing protein [Elizabethkingia anophelis]